MMAKSKAPCSGAVPLRARNGKVIFALCAALFLTVGFALALKVPFAMTDFKGLYYGTKCVVHNADPYAPGTIVRLYGTEPALNLPAYPRPQFSARTYIYPPTSLLLLVPFAFLPFGLAAAAWTMVGGALFVIASFVTFKIGARTNPLLSALLVGVLLVNSTYLLMVGNPAGIAIALCVISVWTFLEHRWEWAGVLALAISLVLKPQICGFVWLYFLLARGNFTKRALQTLGVVVLLAGPSVIWMTAVSPNWSGEMRSTVAVFSRTGGINDPGPDAHVGMDIDGVTDLQAIVSIFTSNQTVYNLVSYGVAGVLVVVWALAVLRREQVEEDSLLALAAAVPLTILPLYHRVHDTKLLLLCIPACLLLWRARGAVGWAALILTSAAIALNGDLVGLLRILLLEPHVHYHGGFLGSVIAAILGRPGQLSLFVLSVFYVGAYAMRKPGKGNEIGNSDEAAVWL